MSTLKKPWVDMVVIPILLSGDFLIFPILLMLRDFHRLVTISNTLVDFHLKKSSMVISGT
jgi:hypothetical protein